MDDIAGIISQFAEYLKLIIAAIKDFMDAFQKKDDKKEDAAA